MPRINWRRFLEEKDVHIANIDKFYFDLRVRAVQMMKDLTLIASSTKMPKKQRYEIFVRHRKKVHKLVSELAKVSKPHNMREMERIGKFEELLIELGIKYDWFRLFTDEAYREMKQQQVDCYSEKRTKSEPGKFSRARAYYSHPG